MLRFEISDAMWGALFGIFVTVVLVGPTLQYFPSPMFDDCHQPTVYAQEKAKSSEDGTKNNAAILNHAKPSDHEKEPATKQHEYECLIAKYTGSLADFTHWLVFATFSLALFGFWQVMVSRKTAKRQLRAYVFVYNGEVEIVTIGETKTLAYKLRIELRNFGQTPARRYTTWIDHAVKNVDDLPFAGPSTPIDKRSAGTIMGPTASTNIEFATPFAVGELDDVRGARKAIFIWGGCNYVDVFGCERYFIFRFKISGHENRGMWRLRPHEIGDEGN
jgi:hypothetical protein